jgi:hypothetical protein
VEADSPASLKDMTELTLATHKLRLATLENQNAQVYLLWISRSFGFVLTSDSP